MPAIAGRCVSQPDSLFYALRSFSRPSRTDVCRSHAVCWIQSHLLRGIDARHGHGCSSGVCYRAPGQQHRLRLWRRWIWRRRFQRRRIWRRRRRSVLDVAVSGSCQQTKQTRSHLALLTSWPQLATAGSADKCGVPAIESRKAGRRQDSPVRSGVPGSPPFGELGKRSAG